MNDIETAYRQLLRQREDKQIADFMSTPIPEMGGDVQGPESQGSEGEPPTKSGIIATGVGTTAKTVGQGLKHFSNAVMSFATQHGEGDLSGLGEALLGGITILSALPVGAGASVKRAMETYVPGLEKTIALNGEVAGSIRSMLGLPAILLDPETRKAFVGDPALTPEQRMQVREQFWKEIKKPMTYGELVENIAMFAVPGTLLKSMKEFRVGLAEGHPKPIPLQIQDAAGKSGAPASVRAQGSMNSENLAERIGTTMEDTGAAVAEKSAPGAATAPTEGTTGAAPAAGAKPKIRMSKEQAATGIEDPANPYAPPEYPTFLKETIEKGTASAEKILTEEMSKIPELAHLVEKAEKIVEAPIEPTASSGTPGAIEIPMGPRQRGKRPPLPILPNLPREGQRGSIDTGLLARMAVGAAIGGTQGDTPQERIAFALTGMIGGAFAPRLAVKLMETFRKEVPGLLDNTDTVIPNFRRIDETKITRDVIETTAGPDASLVRKAISMREGDTLSVQELRQVKQVEARVWEHVKKLADDIVDGKPTTPGELKESLALARTLNDNVKETGQKYGATGGRGMERVKVAIKDINKLAKEWDAATGETTIASALSELKTLEQVSNFTRTYYAVPEALTESMYGAMLLGEAVVKNAVGNGVMFPVSIADRSLGSLNLLRKNRPGLMEGPMGVVAFWEGAWEQIRLMRSWEKLGDQARSMGSTHVEVQPRGFEALADMTRDSIVPGLSKTFEFLHALAGTGPELMLRADGMSKAVHGRMAIQWEAMQKATKEGLKDQAFWDRVKEYKDDYSKLDADALLRVSAHRDHMTFTTQLESGILKALQAGPTDPWLNLAYRMSALPFVRTPIRLADVGAEYTPVLNAASAQFRREWGAGGVQRSVAEARLMGGSLAIGTFMWAAMQGYITGSMPDDPKEVKAMTDAGRPPLHIWDPLAQKYRSYKGIEPLTQWVSVGADMAYLIGRLPEKDAEHLMTAAATAISQNINITNFMQALSEMSDVIKNGRSDSQWEKSLEFMRRRLTVFVPAFLKEVTSSGEVKQRVLKTGAYDQDHSPSAAAARELRALIDAYKMGIGLPNLNVAGEGPAYVKKIRNIWTGEHIINDVWPFNPFSTIPANDAPWAVEVARLRGAGVEPVDEWLGKKQPANVGLEEQPHSPGVRLMPDEVDRIEVLMTQEIKMGGKTLTESISDLVKNPRYARQPDITKRELIQERWNAYKERAELKLISENKDLRQTLMLNRGESIIDRIPKDRQDQARRRLYDRFTPRVAP